MRIGFLGGTGKEAAGLALRFGSAGVQVILGSRSRERAAQSAETCNGVLGRPLITGLENAEMLDRTELIFLTVPFAHAVDAVDMHRASLRSNHVLVDVTVPMIVRAGRAELQDCEEGSNSESIAHRLPAGIPLVAAFKTVPAAILANLDTSLDCDVFVCGDVQDAKQSVMAAASVIPSLRPLDAGPLSAARTLESMAVLAVQLNLKYRKHGARFRIAGI